ncbi:MAG: RecQ family ATP-dependent DNA helicase [Roseovarius sp.]|nr:RecQ family ATP-dependent DNA helicase [Roseovarius sp.]
MRDNSTTDIMDKFHIAAAFDLELIHDKIRQIGAVRSDCGKSFHWRGGNPKEGLLKLEKYLKGANLLVGHNIEEFDIPHVLDVMPESKLKDIRRVDTLWLSALTWPQPKTLRQEKKYRSGMLGAAEPNDPVDDSRASLEIFRKTARELICKMKASLDLGISLHGISSNHSALGHGCVFKPFFDRPTPKQRDDAITRLARGHVCDAECHRLLELARRNHPSLPFLLTRVAEDDACVTLSPWVMKKFPEMQDTLEKLRDTSCGNPSCAWCNKRKNSVEALKSWFGYDGFRAEPVSDEGRPMQREIVDAVMHEKGRDVLGILPTGTGKSICYQLPSLEYRKMLGHLTVVISPLVALMTDQRGGLLKRHGIDTCVVINGMMSKLHRDEAMDQVMFGEASMLLIAPEQLRNKTVRSTLNKRKIGLWVFDEAHCISKWGHDFRPDYRYAIRILRHFGEDNQPPRVLCLTATATKGVIKDIVKQVTDATRREMLIFNGGVERTNLEFSASCIKKTSRLGTVLNAVKGVGKNDASLVYCSTRRGSKDMAEALKSIPLKVAAYHAGLDRKTRDNVLEEYLSGKLVSIAATNAFGMGVDKPDIRHVLHADIPGSLENYVQEAGRAGRDGGPSYCRLFYDPSQIEMQFSRQAQNRLSRREVGGILKALREMAAKYAKDGLLVVRIGDLLKKAGIPMGYDRHGITKCIAAISWLEEADLLEREDNKVTVEPSCLMVDSLEEASSELEANGITGPRAKTALSLLKMLIESPPTDSFTIGNTAEAIRCEEWQVRQILRDLDAIGLIRHDSNLVIYMAHGVHNPLNDRLGRAMTLEKSVLDALKTQLEKNPRSIVNLRVLAQEIRDGGIQDGRKVEFRPDEIVRVLRSLSSDEKRDLEAMPPISFNFLDRERVKIAANKDFDNVRTASNTRHVVATAIAGDLLKRVRKGAKGSAVEIPVALSEMHEVLKSDMELKMQNREIGTRVVDRALLWMHDLDVLFIGSGMLLFDPAITVKLSNDTRQYTETDFRPLAEYYVEQSRQVHIMERYAKHALEDIDKARNLLKDYFRLETHEFLPKWLPDMKGVETERPLQPAVYEKVVDNLRARDQINIVSDHTVERNVLVLAGPGSGKTRVLVHRIAYLLAVRREDPKGIIALTYNKHAAYEIRKRLGDLVGNIALGVNVYTCHGFAMTLTGRSMNGKDPKDADFRKILREATNTLQADAEAKESLLEGYRWILVDEYQDIGHDEYSLVTAIAGLGRTDPDKRRTLFAVGDDDQAIYGFTGASVEYIRKFTEDFNARKTFLTQNYRSTDNIIKASNAVAELCNDRMKTDHPIEINKDRKKDPPGGQFGKWDSVGRGRVQILSASGSRKEQAMAAKSELERLRRCAGNWDWNNVAVIARKWESLDPVRSILASERIPVVDMRDKRERPNIWQLWEFLELQNWLIECESSMISINEIRKWIIGRGRGPIWDMLGSLVERFAGESGVGETSVKDVLHWIGGWGREYRDMQSGVALVTAHSAKGLEFDHVIILDDDWRESGKHADEQRRLYYVAMTRARQTLCLLNGGANPFIPHRAGAMESVLHHREYAMPGELPNAVHRIYRKSNHGDVVLGYGGYLTSGEKRHCGLLSARTGDNVKLTHVRNGGRSGWYIKNDDGVFIGKMARKFKPPDGYACRKARIAWLIGRDRAKSVEAGYREPKNDKWPVVIPEFVFSPIENRQQ